MKKVITIILHDRPDYTKIVLDALSKCDGIAEYLILLHIEPGNEEVLSLAKSNTEKLGIACNTYQAWEHGFKKSDFIVHFEDDTVPAQDCLRYMEYCRQAYRDDSKVFSVSAYNRSSCKPFQYYHIYCRNPYTCWAVGIWKNRWEWVKDNWSRDPDSYAVHLTKYLAGFDLKEIYPLLSRAQNIGVERGVHVPSPEWHRQNQHTDYWAKNYNLHSGKYFEAGPLVTAVMITGMHKSRYALARVAIECFKKQTYPNKELLIINHGGESLFTGDARIRELRLTKSKTDTVGDLRNLGLKYADGEYIISWDDDDWHHPKRIQTQMTAQLDGSAVFLKHRINYSFKNGCALYDVAAKGAEATILHPKNVEFRYPSLLRGSDTTFANSFKKRIALDNDPALYIRFYHGLNLWDDGHIMRHLAGSQFKNEFQINPDHKRLLNKILPSYHDWNRPKAI